MEKIEIVTQVCTFGVVACGLTVLVAATIRIIRDLLNTPVVPAPTLVVPEQNPVWSVTTTTEEPRRRRRKANQEPVRKCKHCEVDISDAQVLRSEITDDKTFVIFACPACQKESSFPSESV